MLDLLFDTSWEVCNRVGGIYAVLSTKAKTLQKKYKDHVIFIGPDLWTNENKSPFFIESQSLLGQWKKQATLPAGMSVRVGRWDIPGKPIAILVKYQSLYIYKDELYADMWRRYHVDSLHAYGDYDESCMFAYGAALVIESLVQWNREKVNNVIAHFEEWTTGMGLLYVKSHVQGVATVFTTHATCIGRSICGNGKLLYDYMSGYHGDQMAQELNMQSKHSLEKVAAHEADAFTTVSDVTARECAQLLERRPLVTPNAFEQNFVPKGQKLTQTRDTARAKLLQVAQVLTGEKYAPNTLLVTTSGRCEFRNKGLDVVLDSLNMTRDRLNRANEATRKIVMFIMVPAWLDKARADVATAMSTGTISRLLDPIITHSIHNFESDAIYCKMNFLGLHNHIGDRVKVIYVPSYLNGNDGIFNLPYYDLLAGMDLSVFPSYYEPWGYTPHESIAFGVPAITSDLAGFGQWVLNAVGDDFAKTGVKVVHRTDSNYSETVAQVSNALIEVLETMPCDWDKTGKAAKKTSKLASWEHFISFYEVAYRQAVNERAQRVLRDNDCL